MPITMSSASVPTFRQTLRNLDHILDKAAAFLPDESVPVEVEYEAGVISQYPIASHEITEDAVILRLTTKHTDCLAKELCGVPTLNATAQTSCCGPAGCC